MEPGQRLSYQYHNKRSETWIVIKGTALVTINNNIKDYKEGETVIIPLKAKHRVENNQSNKLIFIEVQTGSYFGEDDIIRLKMTMEETKKQKAIIVSGYFNPIHKGHIEYFHTSKNLQIS